MRLCYALLAALLLSCGTLAAELPSHKGLIGFDATQDHIFITRAQGSQIVNIHLYGWGSLWPFPEGAQGEYDNGASIDRRIREAVQDGQQVMLTCATVPALYRKSGKPWNMEERVMESMEDRYAARCAEAVQRWPAISRVQVWNELKGYWLMPPANHWDYVSYTRLYNKIYKAVKKLRPDVLVGGGYVVMDEGHGFDRDYDGITVDTRAMEAIRYWLAHAVAFDALCLDAGGRETQDFIRLTHYFRALAPGKPIWWAEYYGNDATQMRQIRDALARDQQEGDIALWWAAQPFPWVEKIFGISPY